MSVPAVPGREFRDPVDYRRIAVMLAREGVEINQKEPVQNRLVNFRFVFERMSASVGLKVSRFNKLDKYS